MAEAFQSMVERYTRELLKQIKPGMGVIHLYISKSAHEEEEMALGEAAVAIVERLHRAVTLHFGAEEQKREIPERREIVDK
jgi:hypothetical protein